MPWNPDDATKHTKKASTPKKRKQWSTVANAAREEYGDDATAIKVANAAVASTTKKAGTAKKKED